MEFCFDAVLRGRLPQELPAPELTARKCFIFSPDVSRICWNVALSSEYPISLQSFQLEGARLQGRRTESEIIALE